MTANKLNEIYTLLLKYFGPQHWWPGDGAFEIIVGAILTQNTNWKNVEKAITNLISAGQLTPEKLHELKIDHLAELIRPAGYYNIKAKRIKNFLDFLFSKYDGSLESLSILCKDELRAELLSVKGIGLETADSITLYAFNKPVFVVDAYTYRITARHGIIEPSADYCQVQECFESSIAEDVQIYNEFHALLVKLGKEFCKKKTTCKGCPLEKLPHNIEPEFF